MMLLLILMQVVLDRCDVHVWVQRSAVASEDNNNNNTIGCCCCCVADPAVEEVRSVVKGKRSEAASLCRRRSTHYKYSIP